MLRQQQTALRKLGAEIWQQSLIHTGQNGAQDLPAKRALQNLLPNQELSSPKVQSRGLRFFSFIPGRSDCKKKETNNNNKCNNKCAPPPPQNDECCPHPPPKCASFCRTCPPEKRPICPPVPQRPPQPSHCQFTFDVKHKPGECPGPCGKKGCW
ncbi:Hypothetical protein NTJ_12461 [Nesidiocoris tenuis]|uniref:IGFBP N-terminal domain-containing protein n=1 Tax=Nesidiocoris tenuis TaxID=355587 RepID=A0ABN7B7N1_9HEMI|nr:Hypothetical protein NTJ_12461 [Nesidiocoris tenuis]